MGEFNPRLDALPVGHVLNGYRIVEFVSRGGQAFVYRAQTPDGRWVAVKECCYTELARRGQDLRIEALPTNDVYDHSWAMRSLHREASYLAKAACGNLPGYVDCFDENGTTYLVMEWLEGESLDRHMRSGVRYALPQFLTAAQGLLEALVSLHVHNLAHLDIKSENVTVRPDRSLVLLDLGATRAIQEQTDRNLTRLVTERTAAPEQLGDDDLSLATDVFQIANLFNEMIDKLLDEHSAAALRERSGVALGKATSGDPEDRQPNALALSEALGWSDPYGVHGGVVPTKIHRGGPGARGVQLEEEQLSALLSGLEAISVNWLKDYERMDEGERQAEEMVLKDAVRAINDFDMSTGAVGLADLLRGQLGTGYVEHWQTALLLVSQRSTLLKKLAGSVRQRMYNELQAIQIMATRADDGVDQLKGFIQVPNGEVKELSLSPNEYLVVVAGLVPCRISWKDGVLCFYREGSRQRFPIMNNREMVIGRDRSADIPMNVASSDMSRRHLVVHAEGEMLRLKDVSSLWTLICKCER